MKDKVEKILNSREWTFADLTNMSQLVKDFSNSSNRRNTITSSKYFTRTTNKCKCKL